MAKTVLVIDDSALARRILLHFLPKDWIVTQVADGAEALVAYRSSRPDLIFLDLNMPVMDGYEVLAALRDEDNRPPIIILSGDVQPKAEERAMALGASAFMKKPLSLEHLAEVLGRSGMP